jgi:hypothetical protein
MTLADSNALTLNSNAFANIDPVAFVMLAAMAHALCMCLLPAEPGIGLELRRALTEAGQARLAGAQASPDTLEASRDVAAVILEAALAEELAQWRNIVTEPVGWPTRAEDPSPQLLD